MKNKTKKIISFLAVIGTMSTMFGTMTMKTSANYLGDVNGDNSISMSDTIALARFLNGEYVLSDYSAADVNVNAIIDDVDRQILLAFIMGNISSLPYTG